MGITKNKIRFTKIGLISISVVGLFIAGSAAVSAETDTTTINATIEKIISVSSGHTVALSLTPTSSGVVSSASDTVTVSTNDASGYTLSLKDANGTNTLADTQSHSIAATAGSFATPANFSANNTWGYRVDGAGTFGASSTVVESNKATSAYTWAKVSTTGDTIKSTSGPTGGEDTIFWYAAKVDQTLPSGTYSDTVTYTATAK